MAVGVVVEIEELKRLVELNTRSYLSPMDKEEVFYIQAYSISPTYVVKSGIMLAYMDTTDVVYYSGVIFEKQFLDGKKELIELGYLERSNDITVGDVVKGYTKYAFDIVKKKLDGMAELKRGWIFVDGLKPTDILDFF